jgi:hypothetical protein
LGDGAGRASLSVGMAAREAVARLTLPWQALGSDSPLHFKRGFQGGRLGLAGGEGESVGWHGGEGGSCQAEVAMAGVGVRLAPTFQTGFSRWVMGRMVWPYGLIGWVDGWRVSL